MNRLLLYLLGGLLWASIPNLLPAQIETYPWPANSGLEDNSKYEVRVRTYDRRTQSFGPWTDLKVFLSFQRSYSNHWKTGGDAGTDFMNDRSLSFVSFAFVGAIEVELTQKLSSSLAKRVEIAPRDFGLAPHFFDGKTVRFLMEEPDYISVDFSFGSNDQSINRDDNRASGFDIRHGFVILADVPELAVPEYAIPSPNDAGVVVWDNQTDLNQILNADIIYFPPGEHFMRDHKDRWERNSSWDQSESAGNWVTTQSQYNNADLYRGRLFLGKDNQRVYIAPGAIVYGGFHSHGHDNNWLYGRGIVTGRGHLMHEIIKPNSTISENDPYIKVTQTKEAFVHFGSGAVYDGPIFLEAWHHTCPSGENTQIRRIKIIGWCSNNDGIRPGGGSQVKQIFIKTSDDYDYARSPHTVRDAVIWPMVNGAVGQLGWNNLGNGFAEYYDIHVIHAEWHLGDFSKTNVGMLCGGKANEGMQLQRNILQDIYLEDPTNYLIGVAIEATNGTPNGFLKDFTFRNVSTEYPFQNPAGVETKQELRGRDNTWVENWRFTNFFVDGVLVTWDNHRDYFNLNLTGSNGANEDQSSRTRNLLFDTSGSIHEISYTHNAGGMIRPRGQNKLVQVAAGMDQTLHIMPDDGFRIKRITVDGVQRYLYDSDSLRKRRPNWTFPQVQANHSLEVEFEPGDDYFDLQDAGVLSSTLAPTPGKLKLYPNPTGDLIYLELPNPGPAQIRVYDGQGRMVQQGQLERDLPHWSLGSLPTGVYTIQVLQGAQPFTQTILKK